MPDHFYLWIMGGIMTRVVQLINSQESSQDSDLTLVSFIYCCWRIAIFSSFLSERYILYLYVLYFIVLFFVWLYLLQYTNKETKTRRSYLRQNITPAWKYNPLRSCVSMVLVGREDFKNVFPITYVTHRISRFPFAYGANSY
jgi:hypothetical protein